MNKNYWQQRIKLIASDFPTENPRIFTILVSQSENPSGFSAQLILYKYVAIHCGTELS